LFSLLRKINQARTLVDQGDFQAENHELLFYRLKLSSITLIFLYVYYYYSDFFFYQNVPGPFRYTLAGIHIVGLIISIAFYIFYNRMKGLSPNFFASKKAAFLIDSYLFTYIFMGALGSLNSQRLAGNIDAYILIVITVAAVFPIRPERFLIILLINHAVFLTGLNLLSTNLYSYLSSQINTTIAIVCAFLISLSFYFHRLHRFLDQKKLTENEQNLRKLFDMNPFPLLLSSATDGKILFANQSARDYFQSSQSGEQELTLDEHFIFHTQEEQQSVLAQLNQSKPIKNFIIEQSLSPDHTRWMMANFELVDYANEKCILTGLTDITELKKMEAELTRRASLDMLTGVMNRRSGIEFLQQTLNRGKTEPLEFIVCFIDVNNLKTVNDTYGHTEGDHLIQTASQIIESHIGQEDVLFRYGGDEFIILFFHKQLVEVQAICAKLQGAFAETSTDQQKPYHISFSHGLFHYRSEMDLSVEEIITKADVEMYHEKSKSKMPLCPAHE